MIIPEGLITPCGRARPYRPQCKASWAWTARAVSVRVSAVRPQSFPAERETYGRLATEFDAPRHDLLESELERHLAAAHDEQDRLSELLGTDPVARPVGWPLRGELISHLDRFRTELEAGKPDSRPRRRRNRAWRLPHASLQRLQPAYRRRQSRSA
jgi:hypothetical protein